MCFMQWLFQCYDAREGRLLHTGGLTTRKLEVHGIEGCPPEAPGDGPRGCRGDHRRAVRLKPVGADLWGQPEWLARESRRPPQEAYSGQDYRRIAESRPRTWSSSFLGSGSIGFIRQDLTFSDTRHTIFDIAPVLSERRLYPSAAPLDSLYWKAPCKQTVQVTELPWSEYGV